MENKFDNKFTDVENKVDTKCSKQEVEAIVKDKLKTLSVKDYCGTYLQGWRSVTPKLLQTCFINPHSEAILMKVMEKIVSGKYSDFLDRK